MNLRLSAARAWSWVPFGLGVALFGLSGCVRVYQPLTGLHRPVVIDPTLRNFDGVKLTVYCVPGGLLSDSEAGVLCQRVGTLFENQGALVTATIGGEPSVSTDEDGKPLVADPTAQDSSELTMELRARQIHEFNHPLSWAETLLSFTLIPGVTEVTFQQDVVIRDSTGFLLASDSLQGRMIQYFGAGAWIGNKTLDLATRNDADKLTGDVAERDLSNDMYRQLSQLLFNANMQGRVLKQAAAAELRR